MRMWGLRSRLILSFVLLIILPLPVLGASLLWYSHQSSVDHLTRHLEAQARIIEYILRRPAPGQEWQAAGNARIKEVSEKTDLRITVIAADGAVLADSQADWSHMENHLHRPEIAAALAESSGSVIRYSTTLKENLLYVTVPLVQDGRVAAVIRVSTTLAPLENDLAKVRSVLLVVSCVICFLAILISVRLSGKYTEPLEQITRVAQKIGEGRLDQRVHIRTGDEVELLAHALNTLASNLDDKVNEIIEEKRKLELILEHMDNAVLVFDKYGRITMANHMAMTSFHIGETMLGKHNIQVIGISLLDRAIQETVAAGVSRSVDLKTDVERQKRVFQVSIVPIASIPANENENKSDISGVLAVFHDITTLQEIHERQVEFVANASHELATPLTAIKGFAETLLDGALEDKELARKFVSIIHDEAERMHRLVQDLLQLAKLDSSEYRQQLHLEPVNLRPMFENVIQELSSRWQGKNLTVTLDPSPEDVFALANPDWAKQVAINLLDNAIKYTPADGSVWIRYRSDGNQAVIAVRDSGGGIPAKDLPLIFDRFYRVDRARSRAAGGTGLGLAIVKFIVETLGGKIEVNSSKTGTTFTFTLPLA